MNHLLVIIVVALELCHVALEGGDVLPLDGALDADLEHVPRDDELLLGGLRV